MCADSDAVQRTVILCFSMVDALGNSTFDTFINMAHFVPPFSFKIIINNISENITDMTLIECGINGKI